MKSDSLITTQKTLFRYTRAMKFTFASIFLTVLVIGVYSAPKEHSFGLDGVIDATTIVDGKKVPADMKTLNKVEDMLKSMIHKHLDKKRDAKKSSRKEKRAKDVPVPAEVKPEALSSISAIKWEDHPETRDVINKQVPGGTEAVDALIKLLKSQNKDK